MKIADTIKYTYSILILVLIIIILVLISIGCSEEGVTTPEVTSSSEQHPSESSSYMRVCQPFCAN